MYNFMARLLPPWYHSHVVAKRQKERATVSKRKAQDSHEGYA